MHARTVRIGRSNSIMNVAVKDMMRKAFLALDASFAKACRTRVLAANITVVVSRAIDRKPEAIAKQGMYNAIARRHRIGKCNAGSLLQAVAN